ncbi:MAG: AMP-binding protein [Deltaproteobacteria bacterium]|nr:MAG: AMP-binding protein [Deltaproteobacteria bacterium]
MEWYEYGPHQRTWGFILDDITKKNRDKVYLYFRDQKVTYGQLNKYANLVANAFLSLGLKKGDKASIMMPNCPEFLYHWFGLAKMGGIEVPVNTAYRGDILRHVITNSDSRVLVVHEHFLDRLRFIQHELPTLEKVIVYSPGVEATDINLKFPTYPFTRLLTKSSPGHALPEVKPWDPLQIIYTSGTTGPSKGVVLSHSAVYWYAINHIRFSRLNQETRTYHCLPFFHQNHRFTTTYTILLGGSYAMGEKFSASGFWDEIRKHEANYFMLMGPLYRYLYSQPPKPDDAVNPAQAASAAPVPLDIAEAFEKRFGLKLYGGVYGLTEASAITRISFDEADRLKAKGRWDQASSMGKEQKDIYEVKLVDDEDNEVAIGEVGEIVCRPARPYSMMTEYINNPQATLGVFRNLWFHTGDLARKDEDGFFYFVDRKKDYLRRRGENISSFEVERVVNAHPAVYQAAAISVKSEVGEDEVKIVVELKEGEDLTPEELMAWCEPRMAYFMIPRFVEFKKELPLSAMERIEKYKLRDEGITPTTWDREKAGYKLKP